MRPLQKIRDNLNTPIASRITVKAPGLRFITPAHHQSNLSDGELG